VTDPPERDGSAEAGRERSDGKKGTKGTGEKGRARQQRKQVLLRLDPAMYEAIARWAADELRSTNAQIDYLLRKALTEAGRLPRDTRPHPRRGRPPRAEQ
jgi:hypothetical protein